MPEREKRPSWEHTSKRSRKTNGEQYSWRQPEERRKYWRSDQVNWQLRSTNAGVDGSTRVDLAPNKAKNVIFIVDEASMIGDFSLQADGSVSRNLLEDVIQYVFSGENCKLIFLGDEGQLPQVGTTESPALSSEYLSNYFSALHFSIFGLTHVVRQEQESGILENATRIRTAQREQTLPQLDLKQYKDVRPVPGDELVQLIEEAYDRYGSE